MSLARLCQCLAVCLVGGLSQAASAQQTAHLDMKVEVLPAALRVTVTSSQLDFAQQHSRVGEVLLDPVTGEISDKVAGAHRLGEVRLTGEAGTAYGITVTPTPWLIQSALPPHAADGAASPRLAYRLRWAGAEDCAPSGFRLVKAGRSLEGSLGARGCNVVRFGGAITLRGVPEGRYGGSLHVRIFAL